MEKEQLTGYGEDSDFFFDNHDDKIIPDIRYRNNLVHLLEGYYSFNLTKKGVCLVYEGKQDYDNLLFSSDCPDNYVIFFRTNKFKFNKNHSSDFREASRVYSSIDYCILVVLILFVWMVRIIMLKQLRN